VTDPHASHPAGEAGTTAPAAVVLPVVGRVTADRASELCARLRALLAGARPEVVVLEVGGVVDPDLATVEAVARLQLTARRAGTSVELHHACERLRDLLRLVGLDAVVPCGDDPASSPRGTRPGGGSSAVDRGRQPEEGEQGALEVEEVVEGDDPPL
jgi:ABC-type transporter Mla MlaB component